MSEGLNSERGFSHFERGFSHFAISKDFQQGENFQRGSKFLSEGLVILNFWRGWKFRARV